jgi:hypothetical protein
LTLGVAAGTTAAVIGISAGVSAAVAGPAAPSTPATTAPAATSGNGIVSAAGQASPLSAAARSAQAGQAGLHPAAAQSAPSRGSGAAPAPAAQAPAAHQAPAPTASATHLATASHAAQATLATPSSQPSRAQQAPARQMSAPAARAPAAHTPPGQGPAGRHSSGPSNQHGSGSGNGRWHPRGTWHRAWQRRAVRQWPYQIYDSVTPSAIPGGHVIATYATGPYAVQASQVAGRPVLWIDTRGSDPGASALDVEPGDATPTMAATWAWQRLHADPSAKAIIYTMRSEWSAAQAAIGTLPHWMQNHVRWWIADPTGYPHLVPGSNATQWYWGSNYDITTAAPGF